MTARVPVAVLGATGVVGQRLLALLAEHPWFRPAVLAGSERSAGRRYVEACRWLLAEPMPAVARDAVVRRAEPGCDTPIVFSALDAAAARELEPRFAAAGHVVVSNASAFRDETDVPLLVPEVNADHATLLRVQRARRGWTGCIVTNPNCVVATLSLALAPVARAFGLEAAGVTTLQAASGAGYPGVAALDLLGNVIPGIPGEAEKISRELPKILGAVSGKGIRPHSITVSAQTVRVPVVDGHTAAVAMRLTADATRAALTEAWRSFRGPPCVAALPSAPSQPVVVVEDADAPQPRRHLAIEHGMATIVSQPASCAVLGWKFVALGHNTIRGAAGAAVLNAELLVAEGWVPTARPPSASRRRPERRAPAPFGSRCSGW